MCARGRREMFQAEQHVEKANVFAAGMCELRWMIYQRQQVEWKVANAGRRGPEGRGSRIHALCELFLWAYRMTLSVKQLSCTCHLLLATCYLLLPCLLLLAAAACCLWQPRAAYKVQTAALTRKQKNKRKKKTMKKHWKFAKFFAIIRPSGNAQQRHISMKFFLQKNNKTANKL